MTVRTRAQLESDLETYLPDNTQQLISPQDLRNRYIDILDTWSYQIQNAGGAEAPGQAALVTIVNNNLADNTANGISAEDIREPHIAIVNAYAAQTLLADATPVGQAAHIAAVNATLASLQPPGSITAYELRTLLRACVGLLFDWCSSIGAGEPPHEAVDNEVTMADAWTPEAFDILANDSGFTAGQVTMVDLGTGTASGTVALNNSTGELTYTPDPDEYGHRVTVNVQVTDTVTTDVGTETIGITIPMKPMDIYLGGMIDDAEIPLAITGGWTEGVSAFISTQAGLNDWLTQCNTSGVNTYLSLDNTFATQANVDYLLAHAQFSRVEGIECEGSSWTNTLWEYLRDQLTIGGDEAKLYGYQTQYLGETSVNISDVSISGGGVITITTSTAHGLSNGEPLGITEVGGTTEINYLSFVAANVTANTLDLQGINGTGYGTYTTGGKLWNGTNVAATAWKNRSRLWYPFFIEEPTYSYDPDSTKTYTITAISKTDPAVVTTSGSHALVAGQTVTIRAAGMTEVSDRQFVVANPTSTTFELTGENATGYGTFTSGSAVTHTSGRTKQISGRWDMPTYPMQQQAGFWSLAPTERNIHLWIQAHGQPMEQKDWDDQHVIAVQPGLMHMYTQLVMAHLHGARKCTVYTYRNGLYLNRHKDNTTTGSPIDLLTDMDRNTSTNLTTTEAGVYERSWDRIIEAVAKYKAGPGNMVTAADDSFGYETPYVGVVNYGQSATRR